jgi:hypothetical protein
MKRLAAILLRVATAGSLVLCVAACALWALSEARPSGVGRELVVRGGGLRSADGRVEVWRGIDPWTFMDSADPYRPPHAVLGALGIGHAAWTWHTSPGGFLSRGVRFHLALPAVLTAVLPVAAVLRRLVRRARAGSAAGRRRSGLCGRCGYDLRASAGRCPECGTVAPGTGDA